jgi:hypothetical protein
MRAVRRDDLIPVIETAYKNHGGVIESEFNHGGIRTKTDSLLDGFNDYRFWYRPITHELWIAPATTRPGADCIKTKTEGAAQIQLGFWSKSHVIDIHCAGTTMAHDAFCQRPEAGCIPLIYDRLDKTGTPTGKSYSTNEAGLNVHRASVQSDVEHIGPYSEGCQVDDDHEDHEQEIAAAKASSMYQANPKYLWNYLLISVDEVTGI